MNYKEQIEFNNECIKIYRDGNIEKQYNQKIFMLVRENIKMYSQLNQLERFKKRKRVDDKGNDEKKLKRVQKEVLEPEYDNYSIKDTTIETYDIDGVLNFNLVNN